MFNGEIIFRFKSLGTKKHMWISGFYGYEHIYSQKHKFQNIFERKLSHRSGQLLLIY